MWTRCRVELLPKFQQLSDHVGEMERRSKHVAQGVSSDIDWLYRLITEGIVFNNKKLGLMRIQETMMVQGDGFLGIELGCGSSLAAELQKWSWLVRLLVHPLTQWRPGTAAGAA